MAQIKINIPDEFVEMGRALVADKALRDKFEEDPVGTMKEFGISLPDDITNEALKEDRLFGAWKLSEKADFKGPEMVAEVEVVVDAAMTPATVPVAVVAVGIVVAVKPND